MKRLTLLLGAVMLASGLMSALAAASNRSSLQVQIVAPECTLDTVDNGTGPTQIITCPPEAVDLVVTPEGIDIGQTSQPAASPQLSFRLQSPANANELNGILDAPGSAAAAPGDDSDRGWDVFKRPRAFSPAGFVLITLWAMLMIALLLLVLLGAYKAHRAHRRRS